jgi:hypothetical protein
MADIIFKRSFLDAQTCQVMNAWVVSGVKNSWLDVGMSRGSGWAYKDRLTTRNYGNRFDYPDVVHEVFDRITDALRLHGVPKSVVGGGKDGTVVSYTLPGGDVYPHKDPMEGDFHVLRCNVMTQAADAGAELFIGGEKINIGVGDLHCYLPSDVEHYVTEVQGDTPRIMWMFGYQISKEQWERKLGEFSVYK